VDDFVDADGFEDAGVFLGESLDGDAGHAEFLEVERGEGDDIHALAEADDGDVDIANAEALEGAGVGGVGNDGFVGEFGGEANGFGVEVDGEDFASGFIKDANDVGTEVTEADDGEALAVHD
jgi:hypothetical protein